MASRRTGRIEPTTVAGETVEAFVPLPLPPRRPGLQLGGAVEDAAARARRELDRMEVGADLVPSLDWFLYSMIRKEAMLSSQIEGTQATLEDLFRLEGLGPERVPAGSDVDEVSSYVDALQYARRQLRSNKGLPLSVRLLNQTHRRLLSGARGRNKSPGRLRTSQNWIGGSRPGTAVFVPPPPTRVPDLMGDLEHFIHGEDHGLDELIRIGLLHVQFETIHPYLDGNGRLGRLLITLLLEEWGLLRGPFAFVSLELKRRRDDYYHWLGRVRTDGDWEGWLVFFLEGLARACEESLSSVRRLFALIQRDREKVVAASKSSLGAVRLFEELPERPVVDTSSVAEVLDATRPTAAAAIAVLEESGVLVEVTGRKRGQIWAYREYIDILSEDAEPITG